METSAEILISSLEELPFAADHLFQLADQRKVWLFDGPMGVGKTTLIKTLCHQLGVETTTSSPTFSIVNEYDSPAGPVYHFDFYRIRSEEEALDLGYEEYFYSGNFCFVEWPEKIQSLLPADALFVKISLCADEKRLIQVTVNL